MNEDCKVIEIIEEKIKSTIGEEQKEWINKYDIFTSRSIFEKYNNKEYLDKVLSIKKEVLHYEQ
ncbi:hypothetical protein [Clostridium butyricum]|uniref:hypothetical protein n=1 Tax=Clostridium butyricum TaxID=1492 RepID=UPI00374F916D